MGDLLGHAVRFGVPGDVMAVGEGIETMLSLRQALPGLPWPRRSPRPISRPSCSRRRCGGSTSSATTIRPATARGTRLIDRADEAGIEAIVLSPERWTTSTRTSACSASMRSGRNCALQLAPEDVARFMALAA